MVNSARVTVWMPMHLDKNYSQRETVPLFFDDS